jgi:two-component system sensor histidine kinase UhpB
MMSQLRGDIVDAESLVPSLTALTAEVCAGTGIDASLQVSPGWPTRLAPETGRNLHRIIEEALRNVVRHSGASTVLVRLEDFPGGLRVSITDDGALGPEPLDPASDGMGTRGMHERAVVIGGTLTIDHARSGSTVVVVVDEARPEMVA